MKHITISLLCALLLSVTTRADEPEPLPKPLSGMLSHLVAEVEIEPQPELQTQAHDADASDELPHFLGRSFWGNVVGTETPVDKIVDAEAQKADTQPKVLRLQAHTGAVNALAFTRDYKHLITGGADRQILLWDAETGMLAQRFNESRGRVTGLALSKNGENFVSCAADRRLSLWRLRSEERLKEFPQLLAEPEAVALNSSASTIIAGLQDGQIVIVRDQGEDAKPASQVIRGHLRGITTVAFSPDEQRFLTAGQDRIVTIWDSARGDKLYSFRGHQQGAVLCAAFSPDGKQVASAGSDVVLIVWNAENGEEAFRITGGHLESIVAVAFDPEGKQIMTASRDRTVAFWDAKTGAKLAVSERRESVILDAAMNPFNETVAVACMNGTVEILSKKAFLDVSSSAAAQQANRAGFQDGRSGTRRIIDEKLLELPQGNLAVQFREASNYANYAALSSDASTMVLLNSSNGDSSLWNPEKGTLVRFFHSPSTVYSACFHVREARFLLLGVQDGSVLVWNSRTEKVVEKYPLAEHPICALALSKDGSRLLAGTTEGKVVFWSFREKKKVHEFQSGEGRIESLAFSPDGKYFAVGGESQDVELWSVETLERRLLQKHTQGKISVAFTPDATQLVSAAADGKAVLWDVASARMVHEFLGHKAAIASMAVSPDGTLLLTGGGPEELSLIWDMKTAKPLMILPFQGGAVTSVMFHPVQPNVFTVGGRSPISWEISRVRE